MNSSKDYIEPEIQDYLDFLDNITQNTPNVVKKERIDENLDKFGNAINTLLVYPDLLSRYNDTKWFKFLNVFRAANGIEINE